MYRSTDSGEKEFKKMVQLVNYKTFYDDTNRELIRLERDKLSHFQCKQQLTQSPNNQKGSEQCRNGWDKSIKSLKVFPIRSRRIIDSCYPSTSKRLRPGLRRPRKNCSIRSIVSSQL